MFDVNDDDLQLGSGVCAVKFSAAWCGPCKRMEPTVEKLESELSAQFPRTLPAHGEAG